MLGCEPRQGFLRRKMKLESLWNYPVKSCGGVQQESLEINQSGILWNRQWMIVDEAGQFLTQRQFPQMSQIQTDLTPTSLILRIDNYAFEIPFNKKLTITRKVKVWENLVDAWIEDPLIDQQLSGFLGKSVQLVRSLKCQRPNDIHFADSGPLHLVNLDSLQALNKELASPIEIGRFRANIIVSGLGAFGEDQLTDFKLGEIQLSVLKPCIRCNMINIDPSTGVKINSEPLQKLTQIHAVQGKPAFGILLLPKNTGTLGFI